MRAARAAVPRVGAVKLRARYLRVLRRIEALRDDRDGSDSSWVERLLSDSRAHYARTRRAR